jgi:hypothetical protein
MDAATLVETVETARSTKLDRLASDRRLLALTGTDLSANQVMATSLHGERVARETFEDWARTETNPDASTVFEEIAQTEAEHVTRVAALGPATNQTDTEPNALHTFLRTVTDTIPRVGAGLVGRPLVASGTTLQFVSFFVNEADTQRANLFRDLRTETDAQLERGKELLSTVCTDKSDWDAARSAAESAIDIAYDEYTEELTALGVDPKPVC